MRVIDESTGKIFILDGTHEYNEEIDAFYKKTCGHLQTEIRAYRASNDSIHIFKQCLHCGAAVGTAISRANAPSSVPPWDDQLKPASDAARKAELNAIRQKHVEIQRTRKVGFWKKYNEYLKTDDWRQKRAKVIERANGICEGCLSRPATQAHHLTYKHRFSEFLFELVAVCDECHKRLHLEIENGEHNEEAAAEPNTNGLTYEEWFSESVWNDAVICAGCRWQTEAEHDRRWCSFYDVSAKDALAEEGDCGPQHHGFDPLR